MSSTKTPEEAPRAQWETAAQGAFVRHAQAAYSSPKGRRVMKTTDGVDLPPDCRDIEFLRAAHLTVPRGKLSQEEMERIAPTRALEEDTPISLYTQRRGEAVYSGTSAQSTNPFARNSHFTNDIRDGRELHATAIDDITKVPHGIRKAATTSIGSELSIELALARFKARLAHCEGLNGVRSLRGVLEKYDTSGDGHVRSVVVLCRESDAPLRCAPCPASGVCGVCVCVLRGCTACARLACLWTHTVSPCRNRCVTAIC